MGLVQITNMRFGGKISAPLGIRNIIGITSDQFHEPVGGIDEIVRIPSDARCDRSYPMAPRARVPIGI